jgi:hypothetical protein
MQDMQGFGTETGLVSGERLERLLDERRISKRELSPHVWPCVHDDMQNVQGANLRVRFYSWVRIAESLGVGVSTLIGDMSGRRLSVRRTRSFDI